MSTTAVGSYQAIRSSAGELDSEVAALADKVKSFLAGQEEAIATLQDAKVPSCNLVENLTLENPASAAGLQNQMKELPGLQQKGTALMDVMKKLDTLLGQYRKDYDAASSMQRKEIEETPVADVETSDTVFAEAKEAFNASQKTAENELTKANEAATAAADFVDHINAEADEVSAETAEANLAKWQEALETANAFSSKLNQTLGMQGSDKIPYAEETEEDRARLATLDQKFAAEHEVNRVKAEGYRTQLDEWKATVQGQLEHLDSTRAILNSSLQAIEAIKANNWQRVHGYVESAGAVLGAIGEVMATPVNAVVAALSSSQLGQYKTQAQKLSDAFGGMNQRIVNADEGALVHEELNSELESLATALGSLKNDFERLQESDKEGLSEGIGELEKMYKELLATQKSGWKKPAESTLYTRIFGK